VTRLCIFAGTAAAGYAGWTRGDRFGPGGIGSFLLSSMGGIVGVYAGGKIAGKFSWPATAPQGAGGKPSQGRHEMGKAHGPDRMAGLAERPLKRS